MYLQIIPIVIFEIFKRIWGAGFQYTTSDRVHESTSYSLGRFSPIPCHRAILLRRIYFALSTQAAILVNGETMASHEFSATCATSRQRELKNVRARRS